MARAALPTDIEFQSAIFIMQRITDHDRLSTWHGTLDRASHIGFGRNPLCGDEVWVELIVAREIIQQIRFHGQGCVVSQACASMLCEGVEGKAVKQVLVATPEALMAFEIRELTMNRRQCALVAYEALRQAFINLLNSSTGEWDSVGEITASDEVQ